MEKQISHPEAYAVKNWIVSAQGFLISCATFGFTSNYDSIMAGTYGHDLFYGTYGQHLMDLLGDMADRRVFSSMAIYKMEVSESAILNDLMDKSCQGCPLLRHRCGTGYDRQAGHFVYIGQL